MENRMTTLPEVTKITSIFDNSGDFNETTTSSGEEPVIPLKPSIPVDLGVGVGTLEGHSLHIAIGIEGILEIFIVIGNVLVIASIVGYQSIRRTKTDRYVLSLAISDLLVGLVIPIGLLSKYFPDFFFTSVQVCVMPFCLMITLCCASIFNLMAMSFDRYVAITKPLKYPVVMTSLKSNVIIACAWFGAILVGTAPLYWHQEPYYWEGTGELYACTWDTIITDKYIVSFAVFGLLLPTIVIVLLYRKIFAVAVKHSRMRDQRQNMFDHITGKKRSDTVASVEGHDQNNSSVKKECTMSSFSNKAYTGSLKQSFDDSGESHPTNSKEGKPSENIDSDNPDELVNMNSQLENKRRFMAPTKSLSGVKLSKLLRRNSSSMTREKRTSVTISLIVIAFLVCWLPFMIIMLLECLCRMCSITPSIRVWFGMLGYANSGFNPIIYSLRTEEFRNAIKHLLKRFRCCKEEVKEPSPTKISSIKEYSGGDGMSNEISSSKIVASKNCVNGENITNHD